MPEFNSYTQAYQTVREHLLQFPTQVRPDEDDLLLWADLSQRMDLVSASPFLGFTDTPYFFTQAALSQKALQDVIVLANQSQDEELRAAAIFLLQGAWARLERRRPLHGTESLWGHRSTQLLFQDSGPTESQIRDW